MSNAPPIDLYAIFEDGVCIAQHPVLEATEDYVRQLLADIEN